MIQFFKNTLLQVWYALFNKDYRLLKRSPLFDPSYYLHHNPDVAASGMDPLLYYIGKGYKDGRAVSVLFDHQFYLQQLAGKPPQDINPIVHYLSGGWREGVRPNPLFDPCLYVADHPTVDFSKIDPLSHYIQQKGETSLLPYFDASFYANHYADVSSSELLPLEHYLKIGIEEKRKPSLYFNVEWYLDSNPILLKKNIDPFRHYFEFGIAEEKSPSPLFDPIYYRKTYNVFGNQDMFVHYMHYGIQADHRPCSWFDPAFYREAYLAHKEADAVPLAHYLEKGKRRGLYPNRAVADLEYKPVISILVPVYNVSSSFLNNCIRSVLYQSYPHWELCLADDCSSDGEVREILEKWEGQDSRIKVLFLEKNQGISGATNAAASLATGEYIGFLDNDDELAADCLFTVACQINEKQADLYYSDEVLIGDDGSPLSEFRKPAYNEFLLLSHNYITHFVVVEAGLYQASGGFDNAMDGAQDFDLFLRLSENASRIVHIPEILYRWRAHDSSTSVNHGEKHYADEAGRHALRAAMKRRGVVAAIENTDWKFFYRVNRELCGQPKVSVIIRFCKDQYFVKHLSFLVEKTTYPDVEFLVLLKEEENEPEGIVGSISFLRMSADYSLVAMYNLAAEKVAAEYVLFLDPELEVLTADWIEELLKLSILERTGLVSGRILPNGDDEFISREPDPERSSPYYFNRFLQECSRHMNGLECEQNVFVLASNFTMVNRKQFLKCGGFDSQLFPEIFADNDLCLRMRQQGYENIYTPFAKARWRDHKPCKKMDLQKADREKQLFQQQWHQELLAGDPYYNRAVIGTDSEKQKSFLQWYAGENGD